MKYINDIVRFLVGALFIFSGFIKSNDTKGFAIKLHEYFEVFAQDFQAEQDTFTITFESFYVKESYAIPLYEGQNNKTYTLQTEVGEDTYQVEVEEVNDKGDTIYPLIDVKEMTLNCLQGTNLVSRDTTYEPDSAIAGSVIVTANIAGKQVYSKTHELLVMPNNITEALDVSKYIKASSGMVGFFQKVSGFAVPMAMFLCLLEILLGIWLLLGLKPKLTVWLLLLMTLFFTFLTFYSAYYNKVTDCGCFGDAIKLTPWESFTKDVVLTVLILFLFFTVKYIKPIFSSKFATTLTLFLMGFCTLFMAYSYLYLPVFDFLKYHEGSNLREKISIPADKPQQDVIEKTMLYKLNDGTELNVVYKSKDNTFTPPIPTAAEGTYVGVIDEKILEKAPIAEIHDWGNIYSEMGSDISDSIMYGKGKTLLLISVYIDEVHHNAPKQINELYTAWSQTQNAFYALTSSGNAEVGAYREKYNVPFQYGSGDNKLLTSMIRSNPGIILIDNGVVIKRWCFRALPSKQELMALAK
jgi:uncharacterized membrane protein YphA (DoxX/SURF4 family)